MMIMQFHLVLQLVFGSLWLGILLPCQALPRHTFVVKEVPYKRLCSTKNILTVNGKFPGPTLYANKGDTVIVDVHNKGHHNITIHWHGVKQLRYPWSDGPEYITQCPIQPRKKFSQKIVLTSEEGTLWWHAHSDWSRATVHGAIVVYPKPGTTYPFPKPYAEVPIILGEWWKRDVMEVLNEMQPTGGDPNTSDAYTINGQPGDLYPCSKSETFKLQVKQGKTYLLRIVGAVMQDILFFAIAGHSLTVVGTDGSYLKPFRSDYAAVSPGQTIDVLLEASQSPNISYYMAAKAYSSANNVPFDNTTATAVVSYASSSPSSSAPALLPQLPSYNDTSASVNFTGRFRSVATDTMPPLYVPTNVTQSLFFTVSVNTLPCERAGACSGPNGSRFAASVNNVSFRSPERIDILEAYYRGVKGVFGDRFPAFPPREFDYTAENIPVEFNTPRVATEVRVLEFNSTVEIVFQGTNVGAGTDHPMHLHGHSFLVVGWGFGNFDREKDPARFNLVDPPLQNTIAVPKNGWAAIRFWTRNPGVWFMHCHIERHLTWGMEMAFIVKDGKLPNEKLLPPPPDMPPC